MGETQVLAIGALSFWMLIMMLVMIWQGIHILVTNHRMKKIKGTLIEQRRVLTSMYLAGLISQEDWDRANTPPKRHSLTIEPVAGYPYLAGNVVPLNVPDHYWPKPPKGPAGNSGASPSWTSGREPKPTTTWEHHRVRRQAHDPACLVTGPHVDCMIRT